MTERARPGCALAPLLAAIVLAAGCGSLPAPRYHSLLPAPEAAAAAPTTAVAPGWRDLSVSVPAEFDRPQWLVRAADGSLVALDGERWAAPLPDEIAAAIAARLRRAGPATSLPPGQAPWRIAIDVLRFESAPQRFALIEAEWTLRPAEGSRRRCRGAFEQPAGPDYASLAAAHRRTLARLGDAIARSLAAALAAGDAPECGAR